MEAFTKKNKNCKSFPELLAISGLKFCIVTTVKITFLFKY